MLEAMRPTSTPSISRQQGFTLIEIMVTIAVLAIIATVALPSLIEARDRIRVRTAAESIYAHLQFARSESIKQGNTLYVSVRSGSSWCLGITNDSSGCDCNTASACQFGPTGSTQTRSLLASEFTGITLTSDRTTIGFDSRRGFDLNEGVITINGSGSLSSQIQHSLNGRISICGNVGGMNPC